MRLLFSRGNKKSKKSEKAAAQSFEAPTPNDTLTRDVAVAGEGAAQENNAASSRGRRSVSPVYTNDESLLSRQQHNEAAFGHRRGHSTNTFGSATVGTGQRGYNGRPISAVFAHQSRSPSSDLHLAQLEEELDTIMDEMGLVGEQRIAMKNLPTDNKIQLVHTHKMKSISKGPKVTPLSDHLKILQSAGTQSLPYSRLEKLRVDLSYQSVNQIRAFVEDGGLKLLLVHLSQLNGKRTTLRREDEVKKELELLRCILSLLKSNVGSDYVIESVQSLKYIINSIDVHWLPNSTMVLRILSFIIHQPDHDCTEAILASLFKRDASDESGGKKRAAAFNQWMSAVKYVVGEYDLPQTQYDPQECANIADFVSHTLALINNIFDSIAADSNLRFRLYERLNDHDMFAIFPSLRAWNVKIINSHLTRWEEMTRRDYNISKSQRPDVIMLSNGKDSSIRDFGLVKSFIANYEKAKKIERDPAADQDSDNDDDYLNMNVSVFNRDSSTFGSVSDAQINLMGAKGMARSSRSSSSTSNNNPSGQSARELYPQSASPAADNGANGSFPFSIKSESKKPNVGEVGSLRDLRIPGSNGRSRKTSRATADDAPRLIADLRAGIEKVCAGVLEDDSAGRDAVIGELKDIAKVVEGALKQLEGNGI